VDVIAIHHFEDEVLGLLYATPRSPCLVAMWVPKAVWLLFYRMN